LLIQGYDGEPGSDRRDRMLAGFCGTLMTPMAANFNIVPAAFARAQGPKRSHQGADRHGAPPLAANILLIYLLAFR
jgi:uncharacterized membrane protein